MIALFYGQTWAQGTQAGCPSISHLYAYDMLYGDAMHGQIFATSFNWNATVPTESIVAANNHVIYFQHSISAVPQSNIQAASANNYISYANGGRGAMLNGSYSYFFDPNPLPGGIDQLRYEFSNNYTDYEHITEGVTTYDLVLISMYIQGLYSYISPYQHIASDVTNNGEIAEDDWEALRKIILGTLTSFKQIHSEMSSYRFMPHRYFSGPFDWYYSWLANPFAPVGVHPGYPAYLNSTNIGTQSTFDKLQLHTNASATAIKMGDIDFTTGNAACNTLLSIEDRNIVQVEVNQAEASEFLPAGSHVKISLQFADDVSDLGSWQVAAQLNSDLYEVVSVTAPLFQGFDSEAYLASGNSLKSLWFDQKGALHNYSKGDKFMEIIVKTKQSIEAGQILSTIVNRDGLPTLFFGEKGRTLQVRLENTVELLDVRQGSDFAVFPTVFSDYATIWSDKNQIQENATIQMLDINGRLVMEKTLALSYGANILQDLPATIPNSCYSLRIALPNGKIETHKLFKK